MGSLSPLLHAGGEVPRVWMLTGLCVRTALAAFFVFLAWKNLSGDPRMLSDFQRWGYPDWFRQLTALGQIVGALLLVPTATCFLGGVVLAVILLGALGTHLMHDPISASASPLAFLVVVAVSTVWFRPALLH